MNPFQTLQVILPVPLHRSFEYLPMAGEQKSSMEPGVRVKVPFGKRTAVGFVWKTIQRKEVPPFELKPILNILDEMPLLPPSFMTLIQWASDYYHAPIGEVLRAAVPVELRRGRKIIKGGVRYAECGVNAMSAFSLTKHQQQAVETVLRTTGFQCFLLEGVTGSGKTEVYLQLARHALSKKQQVLLLVPEISLTPQIVNRFKERLEVPLFEVHSRLTPLQRMQAWLSGREGISGVWIGTRLSLFTPFSNLGLIVVDEEHEKSFKQQEGFRYSGRDLAIMRGKIENIPVILGSATPSLDVLYQVTEKKYHHLKLPERVGNATLPAIKIVDQRNQGESILTPLLQKEIEQHLKSQGQVLLFVNRRGFAPVLMCHRCGEIVGCKACDTHLVIHQNPPHLACHHCGFKRKIPLRCGKCQSSQLFPIGIGSQRLERVLHEHFPQVPIVRIDSDSSRKKGALEKHLSLVQKGNPCILVGTQMLAKGHHFPNLTLVGMVDMDAGLFNPDFRAPERMGQLLTQVAGRAGRVKPGLVLIQTYHPEHPLLNLICQGYGPFARTLLTERKASSLPPYIHMAVLQVESREQRRNVEFLKGIKSIAKETVHSSVEIFGPISAAIEKKAGKFRNYLNLLSHNRRHLHEALRFLVEHLECGTKSPHPPFVKGGQNVRWLIDVDPSEVI